MRLMFRENVYGWVMTGLVGRDGRWFIGYSRAPSSSTKWKPSVVQTTHLAIKSLDTGAGFMLNLSKSPECCLNLD